MKRVLKLAAVSVVLAGAVGLLAPARAQAGWGISIHGRHFGVQVHGHHPRSVYSGHHYSARNYYHGGHYGLHYGHHYGHRSHYSHYGYGHHGGHGYHW